MIYLCFLLLFICSNPKVQELFSQSVGYNSVLSGFLLAFICCLVLIMASSLASSLEKNDKPKEPFLFEVSKFKPSCHGLYRGRPNSYQYDRIGCNKGKPNNYIPWSITLSNNGDVKSYCHEDKDAPLGYVVNDKTTLYGNEHSDYKSFA